MHSCDHVLASEAGFQTHFQFHYKVRLKSASFAKTCTSAALKVNSIMRTEFCT